MISWLEPVTTKVRGITGKYAIDVYVANRRPIGYNKTNKKSNHKPNDKTKNANRKT